MLRFTTLYFLINTLHYAYGHPSLVLVLREMFVSNFRRTSIFILTSMIVFILTIIISIAIFPTYKLDRYDF
ncbi:hypothetical protein C2G38_62989 [Gigaspora rosea]|uniref:Uncharacterized protein n=1 Tax=Gigaspora rosea TaxID=44941 RepID=A0A397W4I0_9GLOM|nr:hypothetical protein C2G38_62989 [Gigaspora rosea]